MLESILVDLKIISKISENQKICTTNPSNISIEVSDLLQGARRYIWSDSREKTVSSIENIIDRAIDYSKSCMNSTHLNLFSININPSEFDKELHFREYTKLKNLTNEIQNTIKGINNLKLTTYKNDAIISSQLDVLIHKIDTHIYEVSKKLEESLQTNSHN